MPWLMLAVICKELVPIAMIAWALEVSWEIIWSRYLINILFYMSLTKPQPFVEPVPIFSFWRYFWSLKHKISRFIGHYWTEIADLKALYFFLLDQYYASHLCHTNFLGFTLRYFRVTDVMHNPSLKLFGCFVWSDCSDLYSWLVMIGSAIFSNA